MAETAMRLEEQLTHLQTLAERALERWEMPEDARVSLLNVAENTTYLVEASGGYKSVLRIHRENYHSRDEIACELAWIDALRQAGIVATPAFHIGHDGHAIQSVRVAGLPTPRHAVLFEFVAGQAPSETGNQRAGFQELGAIAARCHDHVLSWQRPEHFARLSWNSETVFGADATWGNWRDAPEVDQDVRDVLEQVEKTVCDRLNKFGKASDRYNLIHADMRLANLLVDDKQIHVIDFDDCGFGWFMYDFAAAISFFEDDPRVPELKQAWLKGYRSQLALPQEDEDEIETFIMLRRMALLAWIGSHIEAPEPQAFAPGFAATTARLGRAYLDSFG